MPRPHSTLRSSGRRRVCKSCSGPRIILTGCTARRIVRREHSLAAQLARDCILRGEVIARCSRNTTGADASVVIADDHATFFIDCGVKEVEQVATLWIGAFTDAAALNRIARRRVDCCPSLATIVSRRDIEIPNTAERRLVKVGARRRRAEEGIRSAIGIAGDDCWEYAVLNS